MDEYHHTEQVVGVDHHGCGENVARSVAKVSAFKPSSEGEDGCDCEGKGESIGTGVGGGKYHSRM